MDYPKKIPNVGLVNGKFIDEDNDTGLAGSLIPADWGNAVTDELLNVIQAGGLEPSEDQRDQLLGAVRTIVHERQLLATESVAGNTPAYTLNPVPALKAYAENQRFRVRFNAARIGAATLNISGLGAKSLKQYDSNGSKVNTVLAAGQRADIEYDGVDMVILDPLPVAPVTQVGIQGAAKALTVSATGTNAQITVRADELTLKGDAGTYRNVAAVNLMINSAAVGVNGLDTGVLVASTWYSVWVIWNGAVTAGLISLSATAPVMPAGYTHRARVGWVRTDAAGEKYPLPFTQAGRQVQYKATVGSNLPALPKMASGSAGSLGGTLVAVSTSAFVPPTAISIDVVGNGSSARGVLIAPNSSYSGVNSMTNPSPISAQGGAGAQYWQGVASGRLLLESPDIYWAGLSSLLQCKGWEDNS